MTGTLEDVFDVRAALDRKTESVKHLRRVNLPRLKYWNYDACQYHDVPRPDCEYRLCGGELFDHQAVSVTWAYFRKRGMVASVMGAGKTNIVYGLAALLKERGELTRRMLVVCQTPAVTQWLAEARRWVPKMMVEAVVPGRTREQRLEQYTRQWDILIVGYHMLMQNTDARWLERLDFGVVVTDDVDPLLNHQNKTHTEIVRLARSADRVLVMNATNLQTHLEQLHAATVPIGGQDRWGGLASFQNRYVKQEPVFVWNPRAKRKTQRRMTTVGYKNIDEFKEKLSPLVIRHTYEDMHDVRMPELMPPEDVWLDLHPAQRAKYEELRAGVLRVITEEGVTVKQAKAMAMWTYGQQICAGLPALGEEDGKEASVKLDWLMKQLTEGQWSDTKIVTFIKNVGMVKAFQARLDKAKIGHAAVWGGNKGDARQDEIDRFWKDPKCRVMMGTSALERSLNLQAANIVVNVDTHLNPARMAQILGRVRRAGSVHEHVFVFNLFAAGTQEERYKDILKLRQGLIDYVWNEDSDLFEKLSPLQLLQFIRS